LSLVEALDMDLPRAPKIATGFGGGLASYGEICGAIIGAAMTLGLIYGRESGQDKDAKQKTYEKIGRLMEAVKSEYGHIRCCDLTECDFRTPEGRQRGLELNLHHGFCTKLAAFTAAEALRLANEE
jgi:C_GCAxxG_C_C family probable redox protein